MRIIAEIVLVSIMLVENLIGLILVLGSLYLLLTLVMYNAIEDVSSRTIEQNRRRKAQLEDRINNGKGIA